ncbi:jg5993 [Pararge aegeria aegeria]|uniref:Jg5993 protein n=1 Tax=Pararge aegeria aegeria TaxID=348720 RepID=A0A8S4S460_9NEOP|nr:jg5993 [Pararge aegeria aegeria]
MTGDKRTVKKYVWKRRRRVYNDHRHNAAIIIEHSNVCPFRWKRGAFACSHCPRTFGHFDDVYNHTQEHPDRLDAMHYARPYDTVKVEVTDLKCAICYAKMNDLIHLKDHLLNIHQQPIAKDLDIGVTPFILRNKEMLCAHCSKRFSLFSKLNSHMNEHYPNNICFHCGKSFTAAHRLKAHQLTHESNEQAHKCTKCDEVFETRVLRNYHINTKHAPANRYRCPYCNLSFKRYSDRSRHLKEFHNQNVEYPCHLCPAVFALSDQRTKHIRNVHIKHKQFQCDCCPSKFVTAGQLKSHMIKHTDLREFQCSVCKKSYARSRTLKEHMRIHNNDRRFVCEYCNNAFIQKCSLKSHLKTHHPNAEVSKISIE